MAHSIIVQVSETKLDKDEWWVNDEDYPERYIDYVGDEFTDEERIKAIHTPRLWDNATLDVGNETITLPAEDDFKGKYIEMIKDALNLYEKDNSHRYDVGYAYNFAEDDFFYFCNGRYYTFPELVHHYSGKTLHICTMYDYHF